MGSHRKAALKNARKWAKKGNLFMAQNFLSQAVSWGDVSDRQVAALNRMLVEARQKAQEQQKGE